MFCSFQIRIGPFTVSGIFGFASGAKSSKSKYDPQSNTLEILGTQIIGWVCVVNPLFPAVDSK